MNAWLGNSKNGSAAHFGEAVRLAEKAVPFVVDFDVPLSALSQGQEAFPFPQQQDANSGKSVGCEQAFRMPGAVVEVFGADLGEATVTGYKIVSVNNLAIRRIPTKQQSAEKEG
jgi:hypothetical protein